MPIGLDPVNLARCKALDNAENMTDAAYVLAVYLEGQIRRRMHAPVTHHLEAR